MRLNLSFLSRLGETLGFNNPRPPGEGYYIWALLFFMGYLIADVATFYARGLMLPEGGGKAPPAPMQITQKAPSQSNFEIINQRNIFDSAHAKKESIAEIQDPDSTIDDDKPVKTSLPFELVGTIVHGDKSKSVATVQIKGDKEIEPYKVQESINGQAKIIEIMREKVIFINERTQKKEYIEIAEDNKFSIGLANPKAAPAEEVVDEEPTEFAFSRTEIDRQLENLPQILQDAKAVPYIVPGSGGEVAGFKMVAIKPGSIYEKLGLKRGDILQGVNGEKVNSPQKAMELYQALKSAESIQLEISRGGSTKTLNYQIR